MDISEPQSADCIRNADWKATSTSRRRKPGARPRIDTPRRIPVSNFKLAFSMDGICNLVKSLLPKKYSISSMQRDDSRVEEETRWSVNG